jgi:hypothetical protein
MTIGRKVGLVYRGAGVMATTAASAQSIDPSAGPGGHTRLRAFRPSYAERVYAGQTPRIPKNRSYVESVSPTPSPTIFRLRALPFAAATVDRSHGGVSGNRDVPDPPVSRSGSLFRWFGRVRGARGSVVRLVSTLAPAVVPSALSDLEAPPAPQHDQLVDVAGAVHRSEVSGPQLPRPLIHRSLLP